MTSKNCYNCGEKSSYKHIYPVDSDLSRTWQLSNGLEAIFNIREGSICQNCGANIRAQGLAKAIIDSKYGYNCKNLKEWVVIANKKGLKVCELNSCHELHKTLKKLEKITYAEYGTKTQEDIENLSYSNNMFDLVLHSETLEHVNNPTKAMTECRRVLKPEGIVLFTVPTIWSRKSRKRANIKNGKIEYILPASHHGYKTDDYLVFTEFGNDVDEILGSSLVYADSGTQNFVYESSKKPSSIPESKKRRLKIAETLAVAKARLGTSNIFRTEGAQQ